jgi:hypothetical protein
MEVEEIKIIDKTKVDAFTLILREDGILHIHISEEDYGTKELKKLVPVIKGLARSESIPMLTTLDENASPSAETRDFWAKNDNCPYVSAEAFVAENFSHKLIGNFYLQFNRPARPTRVFTTEEEALDWLRSFV